MSIPVSIDPLGTLVGVTLLDSVHVACAVGEPYENLVETAFGEPYYLAPFGSEGYFAEVAVDNVSGTNTDIGHSVTSVGGYTNNQIGSLIFYSWGYGARSQQYDTGTVKSNKAYYYGPFPHYSKLDNFNLHNKVENSVFSGTSAGYSVNENIGTWTAEQNARHDIYITKIPGLSYDFKKLVAHTEHVRFEALPARMGGVDGIAFFINGKLEKFIEV